MVQIKGREILLERKFPYCLKPLGCRIQDSKKPIANDKVNYVKCISCGGLIEIWDDEKTGYCLDCGKIF